MSNTNKNGPSKFKISVVTRISIMFITHTIISKILVNILFVTFISIMAVKQQSLDGTGYASSILIILLHNPNHNLTMVVLQLVWLRICSSSRPPYQHIRCEALEWLRKAARLTSPNTYFLCSVSQWACWIEGHWNLLHVHHHTLWKQIRKVFYKGHHQLGHFTKSCHHFFKMRFAVHCFRTSCFPLAGKWKGVITSGEGVKIDQCISVVFHNLIIWHSHYLSSCTSATIEDQTGGIKLYECHDKGARVSRMWPDDDWTIGIDSMFHMYHQSKIFLFMCRHQVVYGTDIWYWQSLAISCGQVQACSLYLMFSVCCQ